MNTTRLANTRENRLQFRKEHEGSWISMELAANVLHVHSALHSLGTLLQPISSSEERGLDNTDLAGLSVLFHLLAEKIEQIGEEI